MKIGVDPSGQTFVLSNGFGNLLICQFFDGQFKFEFVDLAQKLGESNLQVALSLHFPINIPSFLQKRLLTFVCQIRTNSFCWPFPEGFSVLADSIRPLPHSFPSLLRPKWRQQMFLALWLRQAKLWANSKKLEGKRRKDFCNKLEQRNGWADSIENWTFS